MAKEMTAVAKSNENKDLQTFDLLAADQLPDLDKATELPFDLMADYWTPTKEGECKRVFFDKIATRKVRDMQTSEEIDLECAFFLVKENGAMKSISNGAKKLVSAIENNNIQRGTPLLLTYMGKKKNATNNFQSDNWSVKPLIINR